MLKMGADHRLRWPDDNQQRQTSWLVDRLQTYESDGMGKMELKPGHAASTTKSLNKNCQVPLDISGLFGSGGNGDVEKKQPAKAEAEAAEAESEPKAKVQPNGSETLWV